MDFEEIQIPMPWGHIAAKIWGDKTNTKVLVFHGRSDNAGSFDRLIPYLPKHFCYVCCDLPGHGKSSHLPEFFPFFVMDYVLVYKLIAVHFKQERYIIIGHSFGAQIGIMFAHIYPEFVEKLIMLDAIYPLPNPSSLYFENIKERLELCHKAYELKINNKPPTYSYEEAIQKLIDNRQSGYITREAAEALVKRAIEPTGDGTYKFTRDQRFRNYLDAGHDIRYIVESVKTNPVEVPVLMILGRESSMQIKVMKSVLNEFKKNKNITVKFVNGGHDVHNNKPELVSRYITSFLLKSKL